MLWLKVHSRWLLRACLLGTCVAKGSYHLQLVRSDLDFPLWSAVQEACSSLALCTSIIRVLCQALEPTAFLVHPVLAAIAEDAVAARSGNSAELCMRSRPIPQTMIFIFPAFTLSPSSSSASFQVKSLLTPSLRD